MGHRQGDSLIGCGSFAEEVLVKKPLNAVGASGAGRDNGHHHRGSVPGVGAEAERPVAGHRGELPQARFGLGSFHEQAELREVRASAACSRSRRQLTSTAAAGPRS